MSAEKIVRRIQVEQELNKELGVALSEKWGDFMTCSHYDGEKVERKVWNALIEARIDRESIATKAIDLAYRATLTGSQDSELANAVKEFLEQNLQAQAPADSILITREQLDVRKFFGEYFDTDTDDPYSGEQVVEFAEAYVAKLCGCVVGTRSETPSLCAEKVGIGRPR